MKKIEGGICKPIGFLASGIHAGIRKNKTKKDLGLIYCPSGASVSAVYTTNKVFGASITVTKQNLASSNSISKACIVNSGNANTCNKNGVEVAEKMCALTANALGINKNEVVIAQTGVIGEEMDIAPIAKNIEKLKEQLNFNGSDDFSQAIMTTDIVKKEFAYEFELDGQKAHIAASAKGSGMINPKMATMLCLLTTDVNIEDGLMDECFKEVIENTLNMVSVDGDTSTNDMSMLFNSKLAGNKKITSKDSVEYKIFKNALVEILMDISKAIAKDGEGATKLLIATVINAPSLENAKLVAKSVISSNLLKAAMFAADANWGRILCAIGYADCDVDVSKIDVLLESENGKVAVCQDGYGVNFNDDDAHKVLLSDEVTITINLKDGRYFASSYGCDLTYNYVKINAEYRS